MPNIRLITARPGPSGPRLTAEGFGAPAARGLGELGRGLGEASSQLAQMAAAERQIKDAKDEQLLRERIARAQVALDESRFQAEEKVPSDADTEGFPQLKGGEGQSLRQAFETLADGRLSELQTGLEGERLDRFKAATDIARDQSLFRISAVQRRRDIDGGRASFARLEDNLMSLAADPDSDLESILFQHSDAANQAIAGGLYNQEPMEKTKQSFRQNASKVHQEANFLREVQASVDELMGLPISEADRLRVARARHEGRTEEEVVKEIKLQSDEEQGFAIAAEKKATNDSWTAIRNGKGKAAILPGVSGKSQIAMDAFITKRAKEVAKGGQLVFTTDDALDERILEMAGDTSPEGVSKWNAFNLLEPEVFQNLSTTRFNFWDKLQQRSRNGLDAGPEGRAAFGDALAADSILVESKIKDRDDRVRAKRKMQLQAQYEEDLKGSKLTPKEREAAFARASLHVPISIPWWPDDFKAIEDLTAEDRQLILDDPLPPIVEQVKFLVKLRGVDPDKLSAEQMNIAISDWLDGMKVPSAPEN